MEPEHHLLLEQQEEQRFLRAQRGAFDGWHNCAKAQKERRFLRAQRGAFDGWQAQKEQGLLGIQRSALGGERSCEKALRKLTRAVFRGWSSHVRQSKEHAKATARAAASLGVDVATFRLLQELQRREIKPEDYELLGRLDESVKRRTLRREQLSRFPIEIYRPEPNVLGFGFDFWRLPMLEDSGDSNSFSDYGLDFWRLPLDAETSEANECAEGLPQKMAGGVGGGGDICAICCVNFEMGDTLRRLHPCGHLFHRDCIDRWLLESSTTCPVDKQELLC
mmetsp:Transcript_65552/g.152273  ORF Transcript_65552/g.152273 Transcript_65552/m.152273 type:complete len:278 (+) Transcript_65552:64-897(+)